MLDLGPFSDENFDRKKWVNSACQSRHPQDSVDKHLVDLEMKIQMVSEEIGSSLEEQSASSLLRVPRATREVIRLRDDSVSLRSAVSSILEKLKKVGTLCLSFVFNSVRVEFGLVIGIYVHCLGRGIVSRVCNGACEV